jgi:hypothetical protein
LGNFYKSECLFRQIIQLIFVNKGTKSDIALFVFVDTLSLILVLCCSARR